MVRSFDRPLVHSNLLEKLADDRVATELDWQLYLLQRRFLDYQVNVGNRMIALLTSGDPEAREKAKMAAQARAVSRYGGRAVQRDRKENRPQQQ